ncbi:diguanylate cyclase (GGDEF) domain-containing protein [Tindallia magadiensis]|uniref:Diguanylate cyclase (GGDEF) domain-containing protein n=1 Tax=Tindallia magadiensis TaxID=69895 RepID=A0A1I3EWP0_9FIRM|nr:EAL domain-containing protein [Tindallia magadiensis]SFI03377.1 diguanylate cyclase (GGDEF) domain-containing protein [Tindallia magadiensis]
MKSIRTKLLALILGVSLVMALLTGYLAQQVGWGVVAGETEKTLETMARESAEKLAMMFEIQWNHLETLAAQPAFIQGDLETRLDILRQERDRLNLDEFAIIDDKGNAFYTDGTEVNLMDRPHIQRALAGQRAISDVLISRITGEPFVALMVPMEKEDGRSALIYLRNDGAMINDLVSEVKTEIQGKAYMINDFGAFQAYPENEEIVYRRETLETQARFFPELEERRNFVRAAMKNQQGSGSYWVEEEKYFMGYARVPGTQFTLLAGRSATDAMAPMESFRQNFYPMIWMLIAIAATASMVLANHFSRPIVELEQLFARAADGDLTVRARFNHRDEIQKAGKSFNRMMDQINMLTYYDPVTGLPNHRVIDRDFQERVLREENPSLWTLVVVAPDKFGRMNEKYGYLHGNEMLRKIAERIRQIHDQDCFLYRGLSDEFLILCHEGESVAHSLQQATEMLSELQRPFMLEKEEQRLAFSVGVSVYPDHCHTLKDLLKNAGFAKNIAKERGGRQVQLFDPETMDEVLSQRELEKDLVEALEENQFYLEYQPLVSLKDGEMVGVEALVRWNHPIYGRIPPDEFISLAERSGQIRKIENLVMREACHQHQEWEKMGLNPGIMAINISARHFGAIEFLKDLEAVLEETGIKSSSLEIELTESTVIQDVEGSVEKLRQLQRKQIRISIDDFGTGYSSLSYLVRLPVNTLKIDKSFITNLEYSRQNRDIASTIIAMGRSLGLTLISEGIETEDQLKFIRDEQCPVGQGYYFSKPVAAEKITEILQDKRFQIKVKEDAGY